MLIKTTMDTLSGRIVYILAVLLCLHRSCKGQNTAPIFSNTPDTKSVNENVAVGTSIYSNTATDSGDTLIYTLSSSPTFDIDSNTGDIKLISALDYESSTKVYVLTITATDQGSLSATATVTFSVADINDNAPTCSKTIIYASADENSPSGTSVYSLTCSDKDSSTNNNNVLVYSITNANSNFSVGSSSGVVTTTSTALDYETTTMETLIIEVSDSATAEPKLTTTVTIYVVVTPLNDNDPSWTSGTTFSINENAAIGSTLFTAAATDADKDVGGTLTYSLLSITENPSTSAVTGMFSIDSITGDVTTMKTLDRDGGVTDYIFKVQVNDGGTGSHIKTSTVTVTVNGINDNAPYFLSTPYSVRSIQESNALAGSVVYQVSAADNDLGTTTTFAYSVSAVKSGSSLTSDWEFSTTTAGALTFKNKYDLDVAGTSALTILELIVTDGGSPVLTGTTSLTISIVADNEYTPTIQSQTASPITIDEDTPVGTSVAQFTGQDSDVGAEGTLSYSIGVTNTGVCSSNPFAIDSSGEVTIKTALDRETCAGYVIQVVITDSGVSPKSVSGSLTVTINNVNDNQPSCSPLYQTVHIQEPAAVNDVVTTIACTDADGDNLTYSALTNSATFTFTTNQMKLLKQVDYDSATQYYDVDVEVTDSVHVQTVKVRVIVDHKNEFDPTFATNPTFSVNENDISNPVVTTYTASDADYSPDNIVSYALQFAIATDENFFGIDTSSGKISLKAALDYEAKRVYALTVVATDGAGSKGTGTVTVSVLDVNDNAPTCPQYTYVKSVSENSSPQVIVNSLGCTDPDGTAITYALSISSGTSFSIISTDKVNLDSDLDYEATSSYTLTVKVTDAGTPVLTSTVIIYVDVINVNDGAPTFSPTTQTVSLDENVAVGTSVADAVATDPDGTDPTFGDLRYSILSGDTNSQFYIDVSSGHVSTRKTLDFELHQSYTLIIQAKERGGTNSATMTLTVSINDLNDEWPTCSFNTFTATVSEDKAVAYTVSTFLCTDKDASPSLTYTITSGDTSLFEMNANVLRLKAQLDYETTQSHDLVVTVSDTVAAHNVLITGTVVVGSVNEGAPVFQSTPYTTQVSEAQSVPNVIFTVTAHDSDSPLDVNGQVKYSFVATYSQFSIDQSSGQITLVKALDRETTPSYSLVVKAEDATNSVTATVTVTVDDSNDNTPTFTQSSYSASKPEPVSASTTFITVSATDADSSTNNYGVVAYALSGSSDFTINPSTGAITNVNSLAADSGTTTYVLYITAVDSGGLAGARTGSAVVTLTVTTVNGYDPVCSSPVDVTINENQFAIGDTIASQTITDADTGTDGEVIMSFETTQTKFGLLQHGMVGDIYLLQNLDFDSGDTIFHFNIKVLDKGSPAKSATCTMTVSVNDMNDNPPICTSIVNVQQAEGQTSIATLSCSDGDPNQVITYTIISTTPSTVSPTVSTSGVVSVGTALNYETGSSYKILIKVEDNGSPIQSTTVTVNLQITDLNDNDPTLSGPFTFTVSESQTAGSTVLYTATASSNDGPTDTLTYWLSSTTYFSISPATGEITLNTNAPDYEVVGATYTMTLYVKDSANPTSRTASQALTVTITDVNDNIPVFSPSVYSTSIPEGTAVGTTIQTVTATDADGTATFNTVTYSIFSGGAGVFSVNSANGAITTAAAVDYETATSYSLVVKASDGTNTATVTCNIQITSVNEYDPSFSPSTVSLTVDENLAYGTTVTTVAAVDQDHGNDGVIVYSISTGPFMIDSSSGKVQVSGVLDRETTTSYTLTVLAIDKGSTPKTGSLTLTVSIADVNDNTPSCVPSNYAASIPESATGGETLVTLACTDADLDPSNLNNALTFAIATGDATLFTVDTSGMVKVNTGATFDRETTTSYTVTISVVDKATTGKLTTTATVSITVSDVNDNAPTFTTLLSPSVPENKAVGTTITTVVANDLDSGINKELVYAITSGNSAGKFFMDPAAGTITLLSSLDYETTTSYSLEITVRDKGSPSLSVSSTITVTVTDVNDKPPVCASTLYTATVDENSQGTSVVTVSCPDSETVGTVVYSITSGDTNSDFNINPATGDITTAASASINYETKQSYQLEVTASDGVNSAKTYVEVTVNDVNEAEPQFSPAGPYSLTVLESESIGFVVKTISATDADTFDTVKIYSIQGDITSRFMMDATSGVIKLQGLLDHETTSSYSLTLKVEDSGGKFSTTTLTINVGDVNDNSPVCQPTSAAVSVNEGATSVTLYTPSCSDLDTVATPTLRYSISSGSHASLDIDTATGALSLIGSFDYETITVHNVIIHVSDQGTPTAKTCTVSVVININPVNEFPPIFTSATYYASISESTALDTSIAQVTATDADIGLLQGTVRYYIVSGDAQQQFAIDQSTGKIKVVKALDREAISTYSLGVRAKDDDPGSANEKSADAVVQIDITDVNDCTPVFNPTLYTVDVLESANFGPAVILKTFTVKDDDIGANAAMTITITSGNTGNKFSISGTSLILSGQLDYETIKSYELVLTVTDGGTPSRNSAGRVLVNVLPANDMAPLMTVSTATTTIPESTSVGTLVYDADATDIDAGVDGQITYSIASGVTNNEFVIDSASGELYVGSLLDYDTTPNTYAIIIKATDGAGESDASTSTTSLSIILSDVNDNYPQFSLTMFIFSINENVAVGTTVGTVVVTDKDVGSNGAVTLSKVGGNGLNFFDIDATTGVVTTKTTIDYETFSVFYLTVKAQDGGTPSLTSTGLVKVTINNMNDNNPNIVPVEFAVIVPENAITGTTAMTYVATDKDTNIDVFSLSTANSFFLVNSATGEVTTKAALDRETTASFVLYIWVRDFGTSSDASIHTSTATLTVIVSDINDNSPLITGTYTPSIAEDSAINTLVMTIAATDADADQNSQLVYTITAGNTGSAFKIDSTGRVQVATALDRETKASYTLTILVSDKGTPPLTDQVNAVITITDVNDNTPVFSLSSYTFNINENSNVGTAIGTVVATDADSGANAALTYSFDSFTLGSSSHLAISGSTGAITVAVAALDRETAPTYTATVKVTDSGTPMSRTAYAQVTIYIDDLNDNAPVFSNALYNGSVNENSATTTSILKVVATDLDKNANAAITYSINSVLLNGTSADTYLKIDSSTGVISPKTSINYETVQSFIFVVVATDGGTPALSATSTVTINVIDVNDNNPIFLPTFYNAEVAYSGQCQSVITTVTATDADTGSNGLISYSLQTAAYNYLFSMNAKSGELSLSGVADTYTRYSLDIQASDAGSPIKTAVTAAKVRVDTYVPNNQVVTFRLLIPRISFLNQSASFLTNLQTVVRNKYPSALVRLWCVQEYDGVSQLPPSGRRRLLAEQPVDAFVYVVKDNNSESSSNLNTAKSFLTQDEFLALVAANPQGDPGSNIQGSAWDYYRIVSVDPYYEKSQSWWDTDYGKIITAIACLLGLILLCLLIYFIVRCCCAGSKTYKPKTRVAEVEPVKPAPQKKMIDYAWQPQPPPDDGGQPYRKAFPPMLITDPMTPPRSAASRPITSSSTRSRGPRSLILTTNDDPAPPYSVNNRHFDGKAMDHITGKMYEYNTKTNERRWIE
ncbi:protocadherin Fat 4 [Biomphalaria glabrata]|nr:protocadherin Fat 4 [Biomphalaria glabrata]